MVPTSLHMIVHTLTLSALVAAVASIVIAALFVHDRRQRVPALLLPVSIICSIVGRMFSDERVAIASACVALVLALMSIVLTIRLQRPRSD
jgi:hypothetical protein